MRKHKEKKKLFAIGGVKSSAQLKLIVLTLCLKIKTTFYEFENQPFKFLSQP
jgi:hypothetical protein